MPTRKKATPFQRKRRLQSDREITLLKVSLRAGGRSIKYTLPLPQGVDIHGEEVTQAIMFIFASDPDSHVGMQGEDAPPEMSRTGVKRWVSSEYYAEMLADWQDAFGGDA